MRKTYIDNIRWITVVLVVLYHVLLKTTRADGKDAERIGKSNGTYK